MSSSASNSRSGVEYLPGVTGKYLFRIRQSHVAAHIGPLIARNAAGAVKLDLALRGLALLERDAGQRAPGTLLPRIRYEELHDVCRDAHHFTIGLPENALDEPEVREKKRQWVRRQLKVLEGLGLVEIELREGKRPLITVLADDGSGRPFDDPGARASERGNSYVTIHGSVIASDGFCSWRAPEIVAYLCAMTAERFDPSPPKIAGTGTWYRPADWFGGAHRLQGHVLYPFAERTIRSGLQRLEQGGWVTSAPLRRDPRTRRRFSYPKKLYTNRFDTAGKAQVVRLPQPERTASRSKPARRKVKSP